MLRLEDEFAICSFSIETAINAPTLNSPDSHFRFVAPCGACEPFGPPDDLDVDVTVTSFILYSMYWCFAPDGVYDFFRAIVGVATSTCFVTEMSLICRFDLSRASAGGASAIAASNTAQSTPAPKCFGFIATSNVVYRGSPRPCCAFFSFRPTSLSYRPCT